MADNHKTRKEIREEFDKKVAELQEKGWNSSMIAEILNVTDSKVRYAIKRNNGEQIFRQRATSAEEEAQLLIDLKLAPINKPKPKLTRVDGWENGKYVHYTAYDVSEFWGL